LGDQAGDDDKKDTSPGAAPVERRETSDHGTACQGQQPISDQTLVNRINRSDRWMIWLTATIALTGAVSAGIFGWQLHVMQGQLDEMQADRRPWVKVEIERIGDFRLLEYQANKPLPKGSSLGIFNVILRLTNVGRAPAFNVRFYASIFVPSRERNDVLAAQHKMCNLLSQSLDNSERGVVLFPGDHIMDTDLSAGGHIVTGVSMSDVEDSTKESGGTEFGAYLYGCVDYTFEAGAEMHHQTGFIYTVARLVRGSSGLEERPSLSSKEGAAGSDIRLYYMPSDSGQTN
jgi:hypothetical protein